LADKKKNPPPHYRRGRSPKEGQRGGRLMGQKKEKKPAKKTRAARTKTKKAAGPLARKGKRGKGKEEPSFFSAEGEGSITRGGRGTPSRGKKKSRKRTKDEEPLVAYLRPCREGKRRKGKN